MAGGSLGGARHLSYDSTQLSPLALNIRGYMYSHSWALFRIHTY
jgi:hypothetical protein